MGIATGIFLLSSIQPELHNYFRFNGRHLEFPANGAWQEVSECTAELSGIENMGIATGISLPSCIQRNLREFPVLWPPF